MYFVTLFLLFCVVKTINHRMKCHKPFYALLATTSLPQTNSKTTPSIFTTNHSPLSSENHRSLFVEPAKRGKQRAGGEALSAYHHLTFTYQQHHHPKLTPKQLPPFQGVTTPLPLRGTIGRCSWSLRNEESKGLGVRLCFPLSIPRGGWGWG